MPVVCLLPAFADPRDAVAGPEAAPAAACVHVSQRGGKEFLWFSSFLWGWERVWGWVGLRSFL